MPTSPPYDLVIGLDRSDKKAGLCLLTPATREQQNLVNDTAPEALWEWLAQLRQRHPQARFDAQLAQSYAAHPDHALFASLPGAGPVLGPRLLTSLGSQRERFADGAAQLQRHTGIAPVTKKSGGSCHIHRRHLCPKFHRQSFHEYAKESILWSVWAAAYYLQQRNKGSSHHTAVRAMAYKWQRIIWRCWQDRKPYDEAVYEASLKKHASPIVALFDKVELGKSPWKNPAKKS